MMLNLSVNELKLITKSRSIKDYENESEEELITILSEPVKNKSFYKENKRYQKKLMNQNIDFLNQK